MPCHVPRSRVSHRRHPAKAHSAPSLLAVLDLSKPREREAHDFLCRATDKCDRMWRLLTLRRLANVLLCVVVWEHPDDAAKPFALAEVSLNEAAVRWQDYSSAEAAQAAMERRGTAMTASGLAA